MKRYENSRSCFITWKSFDVPTLYIFPDLWRDDWHLLGGYAARNSSGSLWSPNETLHQFPLALGVVLVKLTGYVLTGASCISGLVRNNNPFDLALKLFSYNTDTTGSASFWMKIPISLTMVACTSSSNGGIHVMLIY